MGQHKTNPTAIAAKAGLLPPKSKTKSKRELERELEFKISAAVMLSMSGMSTKKAFKTIFQREENKHDTKSSE